MTDNWIGDEGAKTLSEILKTNTTLTSLNLRGEEEGKKRKRNRKKMNDSQQITLDLGEQNH